MCCCGVVVNRACLTQFPQTLKMPSRLLLLVWAVSLLGGGEACMETVRSGGTLSSPIATHTLSPAQATSCHCCALCHQMADCASLSFSEAAGECRLYNTVANYTTLQPDNNWRYFVMPRRSGHHQFCRQDSDCLTEGDRCRGRVCTNLPAVTCRVIYDTFGARERFSSGTTREVWMSGWLNNADIPLACMMGGDFEGYTVLLMNKNGLQELTRETFLKHNVQDTTAMQYSIMALAGHIIAAGITPTYRIRVFRRVQTPIIEFEMPREEPFLSDRPREEVGNGVVLPEGDTCFDLVLAPPYVSGPDGPLVVTINAKEPAALEGSIVREDGNVSWGSCGIVRLLACIREE